MRTYKIITLGASGSGKTVFLASMFKALGIQADHGFYLHVKNPRQQRLLNTIYTEIIVGDIWPKGTRYSEISEWTYICRVKNPDDLKYYDACEFVYFDYAGGRLTDMNEEDTELQDIIKKSDALLGLIDGKKIQALMTNDNQSDIDSFLNKDLPNIIQWMSDCQVPIHFVISKWDLLEKTFSLKQIRDRLIEIPEFQMLVHKRNLANSPVRLIPVSSVGSNFANLESDGSMKKIPGAIPKPFQVEVPISCVFPDGMKAQLGELLQKREQLENQKQKIVQQNPLLQFMQTAGSFVVDVLLEQMLDQYLPGELKIAKPLLNKLDDLLFSQARIKNQENLYKLRAERDSSLKMVTDEATALTHAIDSFLYIQDKLELDFPESELILQ
ncbi:hypothetical protein [Dolichospermum circinale]|uniref:hypothetical protein n=1 Tax=Dolichospermum circinale TaxID=109265 RepID=UPI0023310FA7|nr:hypothetical protein [Dolichospermum circinale]MDB9548936.1 hypothetical protein [Dolichospermum circinale CS-1031]